MTTSANCKVTHETNVLGVADRYKNTALKLKKGDKCVVYVKQQYIGNKQHTEPRIVAEYEIASEFFVDKKRIFVNPPYRPKEEFSCRVRLTPLQAFVNPIEFKPLIPQLSFSKNKDRWGLHLKGRALIEIPKKDYNLMLSAAR